MDKTGRGNFVARAFTFKTLAGADSTWCGRGRYSKDLMLVLESEAAKGVTVTADALAAHKKNKPTGNPVGRPKGATATKGDIKDMAAETVAKAAEQA
jgi:hypothetical protein